MLKKLFFISVMILFTNCLQAQDNAYQTVAKNQVITKVGINRTELIELAKTYLGTIYRYGGSTPSQGFDCSGFVCYVFNHFNIKLPRVSREYKLLGAAKKPEEFKVGDVLIFYGYLDRNHIGHLGIICEANGMKSKFIHASSGKANAVTISQLNSGQYTQRLYKCVSVIRQKPDNVNNVQRSTRPHVNIGSMDIGML